MHKFLEEAMRIEAKWNDILGHMVADSDHILLESVRLRNEFDGTDEEYLAYLKEFGERFKAVK